MALNEAGFELALNALTDGTSGINKIALDHDGYFDSGAQAVEFSAAVGAASSGTVGLNESDTNYPYTFSIDGGNYVFGIKLYNDTTLVGYVAVTQAYDENDYEYVVDGLTITLT